MVFFCSPTWAAWYQVTGTSQLLTNREIARERAIFNALYQAAVFSGADLGSLDALKPYLQTQRKSYSFYGGEIRQVKVLQTRVTNNQMAITVRVDISPLKNTCFKRQYRKPLLLERFNITSPQQAALGGIFQFGESFTQVISRILELQSQSLVVEGISPYKISASNPNTAISIAENKGAQYILVGHIEDLTSTTSENLFSPNQINRQLALSIKVLDGKTGAIIYNNIYRDIAQWPFNQYSKVDTDSARFWTSTYGKMAQQMGRDLLVDLEQALSCRLTTPEIIHLAGDKGRINAGRIHGAKNGDRLYLWHNADFVDQFGEHHQQYQKSDVFLTLTQVYQRSSEFQISPSELANSVKIGDISVKLDEE